MPVLSTPVMLSARQDSVPGSNISTSMILFLIFVGFSIFALSGLLCFFVVRKRLPFFAKGGAKAQDEESIVEPKVAGAVNSGPENAELGAGQPHHQQATAPAPKFVPRPLLLGRALGTTGDTQTDWRQFTKEAEERRRSDALLLEACVHGAKVRRGQSVARPGQIISCAQSGNKRHGVVSFIITPVSPDLVDDKVEIVTVEETSIKEAEEEVKDSATDNAQEGEGASSITDDHGSEEYLVTAVAIAEEQGTSQECNSSELPIITEKCSVPDDISSGSVTLTEPSCLPGPAQPTSSEEQTGSSVDNVVEGGKPIDEEYKVKEPTENPAPSFLDMSDENEGQAEKEALAREGDEIVKKVVASKGVAKKTEKVVEKTTRSKVQRVEKKASTSSRTSLTPPKRNGASSTKENIPSTPGSTMKSKRLSTAKPLGNLSNTAAKSSRTVSASKLLNSFDSTARSGIRTASTSVYKPPAAKPTPPSKVRSTGTGVSSGAKAQTPSKTTLASKTSSTSAVKSTATKTKTQAAIKTPATGTGDKSTSSCTSAISDKSTTATKTLVRPKFQELDEDLLRALEYFGNATGCHDSSAQFGSFIAPAEVASSDCASPTPLSTRRPIKDGWRSNGVQDDGILLTVCEKAIRDVDPLDPRMANVAFDNLNAFNITVYMEATLREVASYMAGKIGGQTGLRGMVEHPDGTETFVPLLNDDDLKEWLWWCVKNGYDGVLECWLVGGQAI